MKPSAAALVIGCLLLLTQTAFGADITPYSAVYDVYRNDKRIGKSEVRLERSETGEYHYSLDTQGEKGMARFLNASDKEQARFRLNGGQLQPLHYSSENKIAGRKRGWQAQFDWSQNQARVQMKKEQATVPLQAGVLDPATLLLSIRRQLAGNPGTMEFNLLDEDQIETHRYRTQASDPLASALGCMPSVKVERVRENSRRYTHSWYATDADHILLRLDHGKTDGDQMSLRIRELTVNGRGFSKRADCSKS